MIGWISHGNKEESQRILSSFIEHKRTLALECQGKAIGSIGIEEYNEEKFHEFIDKNAMRLGMCYLRNTVVGG